MRCGRRGGAGAAGAARAPGVTRSMGSSVGSRDRSRAETGEPGGDTSVRLQHPRPVALALPAVTLATSRPRVFMEW